MGQEGIQCPNCGAAAKRIEKEGVLHILCEKEDAVFVVTRTGVKLQKTGGLADLERRVSALEIKETPQGDNPPPDKGDGVPDDQNGVTLTFEDEE